MMPKYHKNTIDGVKGRDWPNVLICHGYRDSKNLRKFCTLPKLLSNAFAKTVS
jgi:hypothetical protein